MSKIYKLLCVSLLLLFAINASAQRKLPEDTFRIIKAYQPILIDANKIESQPEINDTIKLETELEYSFINKQVPVSFEVEPISPAKIKGEPLVKLYDGYVKAAVGNALVPFGEIYYNNNRSSKYSIGGHASFANQNEINKIDGSDMQKAHVELFGKRFWKQNTFSANVGYDRHDFNYYGFYELSEFSPNIGFNTSNLEQSYDRLNGALSLKSTKQDSFNLRHHIQLNYNMIQNANNDAENNILIDANLNQIKNSELYNLDVLVDYNKYGDFDGTTIVGLKPQINTIGEKFRISAGLGIYANSANETDFHFYPLAELKYNVIEDVLIPYAGVKGEVRRNNYNSLTLENPFVSNFIGLINTNEKYNVYTGIRGTLSSDISFNVSGAYVRTEDAPFYVLPASDIFNPLALSIDLFSASQYNVIYDDLSEIRLRGELVYRLSDKLQINTLGEYFNFDTDDEQEAWHRPEIKISASARYDLMEKIIVRSELFYWGEQYAKTDLIDMSTSQLINRTTTLDPIFDANLGFEYRYTKRLSAFIQFNNIAGINYERYQNYPNQGFNVLGGLSYAF